MIIYITVLFLFFRLLPSIVAVNLAIVVAAVAAVAFEAAVAIGVVVEPEVSG